MQTVIQNSGTVVKHKLFTEFIYVRHKENNNSNQKEFRGFLQEKSEVTELGQVRQTKMPVIKPTIRSHS